VRSAGALSIFHSEISPSRRRHPEGIGPQDASCIFKRPAINNRGLTFIDMMIASLLLGLFSMIAVPQFQSALTHTRLNEASTELITALQYAADTTVTLQRPFALFSDAAGNWFKVVDYRYRNDPASHHDSNPPVAGYGVVLNPADKKWYFKDFDESDDAERVQMTAAANICFYPDGHSSESDHAFVLSCGDQQRTIRVNGATGRITVE